MYSQQGLIGGDQVWVTYLPNNRCSAPSTSSVNGVTSSTAIAPTSVDIIANELSVCPDPEAVTWQNISSCTVVGASIVPIVGNWNSGAESSQQITGNGYVEYTIESGIKMIGLSVTNSNPAYSSIGYAIYINNGLLTVFENGVSKTSIGPYVIGKKVRVGVDNGVVRYYYDDALMYTSLQALSSSPLIADVSIYTGAIGNLTIQRSNTTGTTVFTAIASSPGNYQWYANQRSTGNGTYSYLQSGLIGGDKVKAIFMPSDLCSSNSTSKILPMIKCSAPNSYVVFTNLDDGMGSLRQAILSANSNPNYSTINFNIPSSSTKSITLLNALPSVTTPILLDGTSQPDYSANNESTQVVISDNTTSPIGKGLLMSGSSQGSQVKGLILKGFSKYGLDVQVDNVTVQGVKLK
jgi:hypothetical protein